MNTENKDKTDHTGRDRFAWNVFSSWFSYLFVLIPGFIMPRMISDYQGTAALGVWDFTWAFVTYLRVSGFGIGSSVSRYVAKYRSLDDYQALSKVVSTVFFIQLLVSLFVLICTLWLSFWIPTEYAEKLGEYSDDFQWIILLLGGSLITYFVFDVFRGVITGSHRWDVHNLIIAYTHGGTFVCMLAVLMLGGDLVGLSIAYFAVTLLSGISLMFFGLSVCPQVKIDFKSIDWKTAKKTSIFGIKTSMISLPSTIVIQSTSFFVMSTLGPAALAVLSRPISLIRHAESFLAKYSFVLTPMAGSIQTSNNLEEMRSFVLETTRYSVAFTLPVILYFIVFGDQILYLWMGDDYAQWKLIAILAAGYFLPTSQSSVMRVLIGLNSHGQSAFLALCVALVSYAIGLFYLEATHWTLERAAILIAVSLSISQGLVIPLYACRKLEISIVSYCYNVFFKPTLACAVFLAVLVTFRQLLSDQLVLSMVLGGLVGGAVLLVVYWYLIAPMQFREKLTRAFKSRFLSSEQG